MATYAGGEAEFSLTSLCSYISIGVRPRLVARPLGLVCKGFPLWILSGKPVLERRAIDDMAVFAVDMLRENSEQ